MENHDEHFILIAVLCEAAIEKNINGGELHDTA